MIGSAITREGALLFRNLTRVLYRCSRAVSSEDHSLGRHIVFFLHVNDRHVVGQSRGWPFLSEVKLTRHRARARLCFPQSASLSSVLHSTR